MYLSAVALSVCLFVQSKPAEDSPVVARAKAIAALIPKATEIPVDMFDPAFLAAVPTARMRTLFDGLTFGNVVSVDLRRGAGPHDGKFYIKFDGGMLVPLTLGVASAEPFRIHTLWLGVPEREVKNIQEVAERFDNFPGVTSFVAAKFPSDPSAKMEILASHEDEKSLAIGSAFKLYILGALVEEIAAGKRKWTDVTNIKKEFKSFPSGTMHEWPDGAPVTLHTLATLMISQSDNTATDHLLFLLGRERVEAMLAPMGNEHVDRNKPFLSTLEMFKIKGRAQKELRKKYLAAELEQKREILQKEVAALQKSDIDLSAAVSKPTAIDKIEWFASASDLARAMRWLLDHTKDGEAARGRGVLSVNLGLDFSREQFAFAGFKGGSETGVLNLTFVFETKSGERYAVAGTCNNSATAVESAPLVRLLEFAVETILRPPAK